jgi:hypothetical protein
MENSSIAEQLIAKRFREEIEKIHVCDYCLSSKYLGGTTSPSPDGKNRIIFCLNHRPSGIILSRFAYEPPVNENDLARYRRRVIGISAPSQGVSAS